MLHRVLYPQVHANGVKKKKKKKKVSTALTRLGNVKINVSLEA